MEINMAQSAIDATELSSAQTSAPPYKAVSSEYNFTSLSIFKACVLATVIAAPIWASIAYIVAR